MTLLKDEHIVMANELVRRHRQENEPGGDDLIAAEMLWGAFAHALIAVANERGWHYDSHGALRQASLRLAVEQNDPDGRAILPRLNGSTRTSTTEN